MVQASTQLIPVVDAQTEYIPTHAHISKMKSGGVFRDLGNGFMRLWAFLKDWWLVVVMGAVAVAWVVGTIAPQPATRPAQLNGETSTWVTPSPTPTVSATATTAVPTPTPTPLVVTETVQVAGPRVYVTTTKTVTATATVTVTKTVTPAPTPTPTPPPAP